jgi:hypothetical protein
MINTKFELNSAKSGIKETGGGGFSTIEPLDVKII